MRKGMRVVSNRLGYASAPTTGVTRSGGAGTPGAIRIEGRLLDGQGEPVPDGLIEILQADPSGRFVRSNGDAGWVNRGSTGTSAGGAGFWSLTAPGWYPPDAPTKPS